MNTNVQKPFSFRFDLTQKVVRDLQLVTESLGELDVWAKGYFNGAASPFDLEERYIVELDGILYKHSDITPIVEYFGHIDEIKEAAMRHFADLIEKEAQQVTAKADHSLQPDSVMNSQLAAIIHTVKKVKDNDPLYLKDPITLRVSPFVPPTEIHGLQVSIKGGLYLMDVNGEWHQWEQADQHADKVLNAVYKRLEKMFKDVLKEAA